MHPALVSRVIYPLHERFKGKRTYARLRELERTQWLEPTELRDLQLRRLRRLLGFAADSVPYYTELFARHGIDPGRIESLEGLSSIPPLTRDLLRCHFDALQARGRLAGSQRVSTGGSTGVPVTVLVDAERAAFTDAARLRAHRWFGVDVGSREVVLWASPIEARRQDRARALRDWLINSRLLSAFDLSEAALTRYAAVLRQVRPLKLYGYASALYVLARYLARTGWAADPTWPRAVFTTAEPLYDFQRARIESVFACRAANEYGARDAGLMATECPAGGLHVAAEGMIVEILPDAVGGEDGRGEVVVTNLDSYAMPIIRYRTGDVAALEKEPCACGRGLPRLRAVDGRRTDFLVTPRGKVMHALAVIYVLREAPAVREFQVVQERLDALTVRIVPDNGFSTAAGDAMTERLSRLFDGEISVTIELVEAIPRVASGKYRYVISKVADAYLESVLTAV
jgi:phenylacetate-CoA ligase